MLVDFKVANFRSFKNENYFSMEKANNVRKYKNNVIEIAKTKLLKTAVIFGGNANGKTNLINGLILLRYLIMMPNYSENEKLVSDTFGYNKEDTKLSISFIKNSEIFEYVISYNEDFISYEHLKCNNKIIFQRENQTFTVLPKQLETLKYNIRKNQNLLFFAQSNNVEKAKIAYSWFSDDLILVDTDTAANKIFKELENESFKNKFLKFLKAADFNIVDVEVKKRRINSNINITIDSKDEIPLITKNDNNSTTVYDLYSYHKSISGDFQIHFSQESSGTQIFMFLSLYILYYENSGKVLLIDEFDRSLHNELSEALIDIFNSDKQKNQFILTTHELSLMDNNLRQDQIWFAEKNGYGETELYSIYDFDNIALKRSDFGYKKRYLEGRLGATQIVNKSSLLEILED